MEEEPKPSEAGYELVTELLSHTTKYLQAITVGLYKGECVVKEDEHTFTTICIGTLLGITTSTYPKSTCEFIRFPNNQTLEEALDNPIIFGEWYNKNIKQ